MRSKFAVGVGLVVVALAIVGPPRAAGLRRGRRVQPTNNGRTGTAARRQLAGAAATGHIKQGIDDLPPFVLATSAGVTTFGLLEQMFDVVPLQVREIAGVVLPCVHVSNAIQAAAQRKARFLDDLLRILCPNHQP